MKSRAVKLTLIIYFMLMVAALISLRNSAVTGYEISIYTNTPLLAWFFLIGSIIGGIAILVWQALTPNKSHWWLFGFFLLILGNFLISSLYAIRGYYIYNPVDPSAHVGMVNDILATGHLDELNTYPILHILMSQLSQIGGMPSIVIARYLPALLSVLYPIYIYLLAQVILGKRQQVLLVVACSAPLLFGFLQTAVYTQAIGFLTLPLVFYLYFRGLSSLSVGYRLPFIILLLAFPFAHPHTALVLILFLLTVELARVVYNRARGSGKHLVGDPKPPRGISFNPVLISFVAFFTWIASFAIFESRVQHIYQVLTGQMGLPSQLAPVGPAVQVGTLDFIHYFLRSYGHILIYAIITVIAVALIVIKVFKGDRELKNHFLLVIWIIVGELFSLAFFFIVWAQVPSRTIAADNALLLSPIFVAFALYYLLIKRRWRFVLKLAPVVAVIALTSVIGIFGLYRSPYVYQANWQSTYTDIAGTEWLLTHREPGLLWNGLGLVYAHAHDVLGFEASLEDQYVAESGTRVGYYGQIDVPPHFGYYGFWADRNFETIGEMYADKGSEKITDYYTERRYVRYWIITQRFKIVCFDPELRQRRIDSHPLMGRWDFDRQDFEKLENDPTVNKIYSSGAYEIWFIPYHSSTGP